MSNTIQIFPNLTAFRESDLYLIDKKLSFIQLKKIADILVNPVIQQASINNIKAPQKFNWVAVISFLPGVTDNVANTAKECIGELLGIKFKNGESVYSSQILFLDKKPTNDLINPLIQKVEIKSFSQFYQEKSWTIKTPKVKLENKQKVIGVDLNVSNDELITIGKLGISDKKGSRRGPLALDLTYMKAIKKYFDKQKRKPNDIELESIAQTWSEHCKHTIFADPIDEIKTGLFNYYIKRATEKIRKSKGVSDICVSVFKDNSGAIRFDKNWLITDKVETHNSPSALDPFGGAITGICGVNRDAIGFGLGAKPVINRFGFCFAEPEDDSPLYKGENFSQKMMPPKRIMEGVIKGVNSGGNCSGIPTPSGFVYFDKCYKGKPLVFVGTAGLVPQQINGKKSYLKKARPGDYIVMIGGRVGLDGIHGATFSSEAMDSGSPSTAVQIGDPITQKKLSDAVVKEARDLGLYNSITDNGAGGLSCSVAEMAKESGGCEVGLEKVPLKYPGLEPWQIWISESQERMTLSVPPKKWKRFQKLMQSRGVESSIIGKFTNSGKCIVNYKKNKIMDVQMGFLHDGLPSRPMKTRRVANQFAEPNIPRKQKVDKLLLKMLKQVNLSSFEFISQQYDHEVQGGSVIKPLQGAGRVNCESAVVRPLLYSDKGVAVSQGFYPSYSQINCYQMAACSIDTAVRNLICVGAKPEKIVLLDNFCWCSSNEPERLGQLKATCKACYDYAVAYQTPFISGKDSMFNDFNGYDYKGRPVKISVQPTLLISSLAVIDDIKKAVSLDFKIPGDFIYILGETFDELGGSEYFKLHNAIGNSVPRVNGNLNKKVYKSLSRAIRQMLVSSAISITRGGLAVALAKSSIAGQLGLEVLIDQLPGKTSRPDFALFSESQGRIVISINPKNKSKIEKIFKNLPIKLLGKVRKDKKFTVNYKKNKIINTDVISLTKAYKLRFKDF